MHQMKGERFNFESPAEILFPEFDVALDTASESWSFPPDLMSEHSSTMSAQEWSGRFKNARSWKENYKRTNRNSGLKNLRCFPFCSDNHAKFGFCGNSISVELLQNSDNFGNVFAFGRLISITKKAVNEGLDLGVGETLPCHELDSRLRSTAEPFKDFWQGETVFEKVNGNTRQLVFSFNTQKTGWHYGWRANRHISNFRHVFQVYFCTRVENTYRCVHIIQSPTFAIYSRKSKRKPDDGDEEPKITKRVGTTLNSIYSVLGFIEKMVQMEQAEVEALLKSEEADKDPLIKFARFMLSEEEGLSEEMELLQSGLGNMSARQQPEEEVVKLLQKKFQEFMHNSNEDPEKFFETRMGSPATVARRAVAFGACDDLKRVMAELKKPPKLPRSIEIDTVGINYLSKLNGPWISDEDTLGKLDILYKEMQVPFALRKCYLCVWKKISFSYNPAEPNKITCKFSPKLLSKTTVTYDIDGKLYPWPLGAPLGVTGHDAIGVKAFCRRLSNGDPTFFVEHFHTDYKIRRSFSPSESLETMHGTMLLFEKAVDPDCVEWTEMYSDSCLYKRDESML